MRRRVNDENVGIDNIVAESHWESSSKLPQKTLGLAQSQCSETTAACRFAPQRGNRCRLGEGGAEGWWLGTAELAGRNRWGQCLKNKFALDLGRGLSPLTVLPAGETSQRIGCQASEGWAGSKAGRRRKRNGGLVGIETRRAGPAIQTDGEGAGLGWKGSLIPPKRPSKRSALPVCSTYMGL
jgi:hypothetical protein